MRVTPSKLKRKLRKSDTEERCGLILKDGTILDCANIHPEPARAFMVDPRDLIANEDELAGTWHTHPGQGSALSQDDYVGFSQWPELTHCIVGTDGVSAYRCVDGIVQEVDLAAH